MRFVWLLALAGCPKPAETTEMALQWQATEGVVLAGKGEIQVRTELVFGASRSGGEVTPAEWTFFLDEVVTPRFPDGYTVWEAEGRWRGENGEVLREPARVVLIVHPPSGDDDRAIEQIRAAYVARFEQEGVLRIDTPALSSY
jgi:hypothetical protein